MHRLTLASSLLITGLVAFGPLALFACESKKPPPKTATDTTSDSEGSDGGSGGSSGGSDTSASNGGDGGKDDCVGFEVDKLDEALMKASCEMSTTTAAQGSVNMKDKLEIRATPFPTKVQGGGTMEIVLTFVNKSKAPLTLYFTINPEARFTVEAYDAKNNRADMPKGQPPALPKDMSYPSDPEQKVARYTLAPNGSGKVKMNWQASKTKWAPEKVKGALLEHGYPRVASGPLPKGKYTLRIVTPLVGVFEGNDKEVSAPKIPIEVN